MSAYFVAGTDTGVGKTRVAAALLYAARQRGLTTLGLKPVAAGCEPAGEGPEPAALRNDDALRLRQHSTEELTYQQTNPVALAPPIAPHIAAERAGVSLCATQLAAHCRPLLERAAFTLVEGAGGWRVPLNERESLADLPRQLALPVILVVGVRLGCLNHALLTAEAIERDGLKLAGWVASGVDPEADCVADNIAALEYRLNAPCLGRIPPLACPEPEVLAEYLSLDPLL